MLCWAADNKLNYSLFVSWSYFQESSQLLILTVKEKMVDDRSSPGQLMSDTDDTWTVVKMDMWENESYSNWETAWKYRGCLRL